MMKKRIILLLLLPALLISGCISESAENSGANKDEVCISWPPSQFVSEEELVKTIKAFKDNPKQMVKTELRGEISNRDELDKRDYYYMPVIIPSGYELHSIIVVQDNLRSTYKKDAYETDTQKMYSFGYYSNDDWTIEKIIKVDKLVQSRFSDKLFFFPLPQQSGYSLIFYELDNLVCYLKVPYEISLDDEEQVKMIEELCQMEKKMIE